MNQDEVRALFASLGPIESCKLVRDKITGKFFFLLLDFKIGKVSLTFFVSALFLSVYIIQFWFFVY